MIRWVLLVTGCACIWLGGCGGTGSDNRFVDPGRMDNGLVIVLPGIEGESPANHDIRRGLVQAGIPHAIPIYRWGVPVPVAGPLINQTNVLGNRVTAQRIAQWVTAYQDAHPGKPVYMVGHSGGGGMAVFTTEELPPGRHVEGLVLLSASISSGYNMSKALAKTRKGIVSFYTEEDVGLLVIGTTVAGNVDGVHGPAAGSVGFKVPSGLSSQQRGAYGKLYQVRITGSGDPHFAATRAGFVASRVAPWVSGQSWPATSASRVAEGESSDAPDTPKSLARTGH